MNKELEEIKNKISEYYGLSCYSDISKNDMLRLETFIIDKVNNIKQAFTDMQQEIQNLKIDIYQKNNLIDKYHKVDFPNDRKEIELLQSKLDKIEKVMKNTISNQNVYVDLINGILKEETK